MKAENQDFRYFSMQNLIFSEMIIVPVVGDFIEDFEGGLWRVVGRTIRPNNCLIVHTEKVNERESQ